MISFSRVCTEKEYVKCSKKVPHVDRESGFSSVTESIGILILDSDSKNCEK